MKSIILILSRHDTTAGPMAAAYLEQKLTELQDTEHLVCSAGLQARRSDSVGEGARKALAAAGIPLRHIGAIPLSYKDIQTADLIVCLSREIKADLKNRFHFDGPKAILLMNLIGKTDELYEPKSAAEAANAGCLAMMRPALDALAERLV